MTMTYSILNFGSSRQLTQIETFSRTHSCKTRSAAFVAPLSWNYNALCPSSHTFLRAFLHPEIPDRGRHQTSPASLLGNCPVLPTHFHINMSVCFLLLRLFVFVVTSVCFCCYVCLFLLLRLFVFVVMH